MSPATPAASDTAGDYQAQKALLAKLDKGELQLTEVQSKTKELFEVELAKLN